MSAADFIAVLIVLAVHSLGLVLVLANIDSRLRAARKDLDLLTARMTARDLRDQEREKPKSREERIAEARGALAFAAAVEVTLGDAHEHKLPAAMLLAMERSKAAHAKATLRSLGIEK